ncbi:hypothetical protein, partial [Cetobacterium sp.]|uniref:hypothetical protein n=1 Tax=Cetobacterium sp. TaxID=2071632 RepID=UPI003EE5D369
DECRKRCYGALKIIEELENEAIEGITDEKTLSKMILKEIEIDKKIKKNQTLRTEINRNLRQISRNELMQDILSDAIKNLKPIEIAQPSSIFVGRSNKQAILPISDIHFGKAVRVVGLDGEEINVYNADVYKKRMDKLLNETVRICSREGVGIVNLLFTGDLIDGILRMTQLQRLQYGIVDSVMILSEHLSVWINELSKYVKVKLRCCLGNHSQIRPLGSQNGDFADENMERIIMWYLKSRLKDNINVEFFGNDGDYILFECLGVNVMSSHGEERNLAQAIKDYMALYGIEINMFIAGHFHNKQNETIGINRDGIDIEFCRVKSICGGDEYSTNHRLRRNSGAGTNLFIIEEGKGKTVTYDIGLQNI